LLDTSCTRATYRTLLHLFSRHFVSMATTCLSPDFQFLVSRRIPPELILKTIQHLPFEDGKRIASLCAIPNLRDLIKTYEHSITRWFMKKELRHASVDFPYNEKFGLHWLSNCVSRYDVVDAVMDELTWRENCVAVEPHNVAAVNAGLLLLYRLASIRKFASLHSLILLTHYILALSNIQPDFLADHSQPPTPPNTPFSPPSPAPH
jgi:hypothetical protein